MGLLLCRVLMLLVTPVFFLVCAICAVFVRLTEYGKKDRPRLVWGTRPIINNHYWSKAMSLCGHDSETFVTNYYSDINDRGDWDRVLVEEYKWLPWFVKPFAAFLQSLFKYDVFFVSFAGFFLGDQRAFYIRYLQAQVLKIAGKKIVVIPFGSDAYIYRRVRSSSLAQGLMMSYPQAARNQKVISKDVDYWCEHADIVIGGFMGFDGIGRWDILMPSPLFIDLNKWFPSIKSSVSDGVQGEVIIVHTPNHRGFKGTEFLIDAVNTLRSEGLKVRLRLLENMKNSVVRDVLNTEADILVEQLVFTGHGLSALEGMASGLVTISNLEDADYLMPLRRWSYFDECPLVSSSPETIVDVLRWLVTNPELRNELGAAGRSYVEKYHGLDSAEYLFKNILASLYGQKIDLINLYHPLLGEYPKRLPRIQHPLVSNRLSFCG